MKKDTAKKTVWAVIGGGNGGQATSGHLAIMGFPVRIYDIVPETIEAINKKGGIEVDGCVKGFGKLEFATLDIEKALDGADIVMVVAPALAHRAIAKSLSGSLSDGQILFIHPGATCGALEFKKVLEDEGCKADVIISEAMSLIYAARLSEPGKVSILGIKDRLMVAALPANKTDVVLERINEAYPMMYAGKNVLQTSLENLNSVVHPGPTLLNTSMIESGRDWKYYWDGITPTIGDFVIEIDKERMAVGEAFGVELKSVMEWYELLYGSKGENLTEAVRNTEAYGGIQGQKRVDTRYVLEDIPMGLLPMMEFGKLAGVSTERMETVAALGGFLLKKDFRENGRTLERLGLDNMSVEEINKFLETGLK
ncbi:MAG TPA: NAD/NADP octopine/nopaline dehydrogenase family protein [Clostridia bacterium]|nr:NAD/NADP octopine/nopaline dehydrogenase family protein [Clostridia bacterium]